MLTILLPLRFHKFFTNPLCFAVFFYLCSGLSMKLKMFVQMFPNKSLPVAPVSLGIPSMLDPHLFMYNQFQSSVPTQEVVYVAR